MVVVGQRLFFYWLGAEPEEAQDTAPETVLFDASTDIAQLLNFQGVAVSSRQFAMFVAGRFFLKACFHIFLSFLLARLALYLHSEDFYLFKQAGAYSASPFQVIARW